MSRRKRGPRPTRFVLATEYQGQVRRAKPGRHLGTCSAVNLYGWDRRQSAREYAARMGCHYLVWVTNVKYSAAAALDD